MSEAISRLLSYVLRHHPDEFGLELRDGGWVGVDELVAALRKRGHHVTDAVLCEVVRTNDKQRFSLSADRQQIRANQGHSISVDLQLAVAVPPATLFHGTVRRALPGITKSGLTPRSRNHVHLSPDIATASVVGARRGSPVVLEVMAIAMNDAGYHFYRSANGVWLTKHVPTEFIRFPTED